MEIFWKSEIVMGSNRGLIPVKIKETRYCCFNWCYWKTTEELGSQTMDSWMSKIKRMKK